MKLKEFYEKLTEMIDNDTGLLECDVVYCTDDEGNSYNPSHYTPTVYVTDEVRYDMEVVDPAEVASEDKEYYSTKVICIN